MEIKALLEEKQQRERASNDCSICERAGSVRIPDVLDSAAGCKDVAPGARRNSFGMEYLCSLLPGTLVLGYLYAHKMTQIPLRAQAAVHAVFFIFVAIALPGQVGKFAPDVNNVNVIWLLGQLVLYIGLPFAFLSSTAPLLQHWFSRTSATTAKDPYFLYAASNAGSFLHCSCSRVCSRSTSRFQSRFRTGSGCTSCSRWALFSA